MSKTLMIQAETFVAAQADVSEVGEHYAKYINGKVTVTCGSHSFEVWAERFAHDGRIYAFGFMGQYVTGTKLWRATVLLNNGQMYVRFGRDDRSGNFNKQNAVSYNPKEFYGV